MFRQLVDLLKEVFWIKPSRKKKSQPARLKTVKKKILPKKKVSLKKKAPKAVVPKPLKVKAPKKTVVLNKKVIELPEDSSLNQVGRITHYFERIKVCVVEVTDGTILIGDKLTMKGIKTKFVQKVWSMQIESEDVKVAKKGQLIGLKVEKPVAVGDKVYKN